MEAQTYCIRMPALRPLMAVPRPEPPSKCLSQCAFINHYVFLADSAGYCF